MPQLKVTVYDPKGQSYAPRIKERDWEKFRPVITYLHSQKVPRKVMLSRLSQEYDFRPTIGQLQAKMKEWSLKVYSKEHAGEKRDPSTPAPVTSPSHRALTDSELNAVNQWHYNPMDIAAASGILESWGHDYRIHPQQYSGSPPHDQQRSAYDPFEDRALPPEYHGGGILSNTADPHWPVPGDESSCQAMLRAANYYYAVQAFQQAFSIYRAVYRFQRQAYAVQDERLVQTILHCANSAVTEHQRNIMHSVLIDIGGSSAIDMMHPLFVECLQSASLNMLSFDTTQTEEADLTIWGRSVAHMWLSNKLKMGFVTSGRSTDLRALLYSFEHNLLMHEHETNTLAQLLSWAEAAIDKLHHALDDVYVGAVSCDEEYYRRVAQNLSGQLVSLYCRDPTEIDCDLVQEPDRTIMDPCAFSFSCSSIEAIVAVAFMIVDASRYCSGNVRSNMHFGTDFSMWLVGAVNIFKRGTRMLSQLNERSRCEAFSKAYLERFYVPGSLRQTMFQWKGQPPAIVDSVAMSIAQRASLIPLYPMIPNLPLAASQREIQDNASALFSAPQTCDNQSSLPTTLSDDPIELDVKWPDRLPSPTSETKSFMSFMNTYKRTLSTKGRVLNRSGTSSPFDTMSLGSVGDFKLGSVSFLTSTPEIEGIFHTAEP